MIQNAVIVRPEVTIVVTETHTVVVLHPPQRKRSRADLLKLAQLIKPTIDLIKWLWVQLSAMPT